MEQLQASGNFSAQEARPGTHEEAHTKEHPKEHSRKHSEEHPNEQTEREQFDGVPEQMQTSFAFSDPVPAAWRGEHAEQVKM